MKQIKRTLSLILCLAIVLAMVYFGPVTHSDAVTASSYISASYESSLRVSTVRVSSLKEIPSAAAAVKYTLPADTTLTVTALHRSTEGTFWYAVSFYGMTLYIEAVSVRMLDHLTGDVTGTDLMTPAALGYKAGFPLGGTISATYNKLGTVTAAVHYSSNITAAPAIVSEDTINGKSYSIDNSVLDSNMIFSDLAAGSYTFLLSVEAISYYIDDAGSLCTHSQTVILDNKPLIITNASSANPIIAKGIDVSVWQPNINWKSVATQVDFAIFRISYGTNGVDSEYYENVSGCTANNIPFGIYIYSLATTVAQAEAEAKHVLSILNGIELELPVYFDFEDSSQASLSNSTKLAIVKAFCEIIKDAGYEPGIYASLSWFNSYFLDDYYDTLPKWVAQINSKCTYTGGVQMWQYSWEGSFSGITGDVDSNYFYGEFPGKNTDISYLSSCTYYPSNLDVAVSTAVNMRQYPSTDHSVLENIPKGTQLHVTGLYKNTYGNYWYQVDRNGVTGYIDAQYAEATHWRYDDVAVIDPTMEDIALNSGYYLKGRVASKYNNLGKVTAKVYSGEDTLSTPVLASSDSPNTKKYTLNHSPVCDNLIFSDLETGYYTYEVSADVTNYYVSGGVLTSETKNVVLWTKPFTVGSATVEPPAGISCDHNIVTVSGYPATCTANGLTDGSSCTKCGLVMVSQTVIPATGHSYVSSKIPATCQDYEKIGYSCSYCGDAYSVYATDPDNLWTETRPEGADESLLEVKQQYRYSDFETITINTSVPSGYTVLNQKWIQTESGTVKYVTQWPSGFETTHSLYSQYNRSPKTSMETDTQKVVTDSTQLIGYVYYHWCRNSYTGGPINRTTSATKDATHCAFHGFFADTATVDPTTLTPASDGSITYANGSACKDSWWWYYIPVYAQNYTAYKIEYTCQGWTDWSDWSDSAATVSDMRKVETRTLYRDNGALLGEHNYVNNVCTLCGVTDVCLHTNHNTDGLCTKCGETVTHTYVNRVCTVCGKKLPNPSITPKYPTVSFEGEIQMNIYFTVSDSNGLALEDMGLLTWSAPRSEGTIDTAQSVIPGAISNGSNFIVRTNGIPAKKLGDLIYCKIYIKLEDGSYIYSSMFSTSPELYALSIIRSSGSSKEVRALGVALLNYGSRAQEYFDYKPYDLMNADLTDEERALVAPYAESMIDALPTVGSVKIYNFQRTGGYSTCYPSVSFEGAFGINIYYGPTNPMDGDLTMYYWTQDRYESVSQLTNWNASGFVVTQEGGADGELWGTLSGIAAKEINQPVYFAGVYTSDGVSYCTGVLVYSLGQYCKINATVGEADAQALASATAVYGYYAKAYFDSIQS